MGILCGMLGVFVMQQPYLAEGNTGTLSAVTGSFTSAVALIGLHRLKHVAANAVVVHFSTVSVLMLLTMLFLVPPEATANWPLQMKWPMAGLLLGVGVSATIGQLLLTRAFAAGAPARVSVVGLSQVGFAMIFDMAIWQREFALHSVAGILLVMGPTVWMMLSGDSKKD
jgi:drug/metabolite transporter (DMT)-like permease